MRVAVMGVGHVRMAMAQARMAMAMNMRLARRIARGVDMLMMFVMNMTMGVLERHVHMLMIVPLSQMQPYAGGHQHAGGYQLQR